MLDEWFTRQVAPRLAGRAVLVRYADDAVIIFEREQAQRVRQLIRDGVALADVLRELQGGI